ncbi:hypothetical protein [Kribbella qitaiheensis]|uniref:hypothetical protein n=1 Tax=Kribbella qitaiheensis TaxID=1544730 RepID=UPI0016276BD2|nr:hypothetical protein [Kribbella qitaiheensis]
MKLGDGTGLVARFLEEAGIPKATRQAVDLVSTDGAGQMMYGSAKVRADLIEQLAQRMAPAMAEMMIAQLAPVTDGFTQSVARELQPTIGAAWEAIARKLLAAPTSVTSDGLSSGEDQIDADSLVTTDGAETAQPTAEAPQWNSPTPPRSRFGPESAIS